MVHRSSFAEGQDVLVPFARHSRLHQPGRALRQNDLVVRRNMIAVGMRHEREPFHVPRVQPQILRRQINAALVSNIDHTETYSQNRHKKERSASDACTAENDEARMTKEARMFK